MGGRPFGSAQCGGVAWRLMSALVLVVALVVGTLALPAPLAAATIVVRSGANAGGSCPGASCTLRQAIAVAAPGDTITFAPNVTVVTLTTGELVIGKNLTIQGSGLGGVTVRRSPARNTPAFRIFHVTGGANVTLRGLTVTNGLTEDSAGGIQHDGGVLTVESSIVTANEGGGGGGIMSNADGTLGHAALTVTGSIVSDNRSGYHGGGILLGAGGGTSATMWLLNSTVSGNSAGSYGGGISSYADNGGTITANVDNSTVSDNVSGGNGGGIYNFAISFDSLTGVLLKLANSTISGNRAAGDGGGAMAVNVQQGSVAYALTGFEQATFVDNVAGSGGHQIALTNPGASATYSRSIFTHRQAAPAGDDFVSINGAFTSFGDNVARRDLPNAIGTDLINTDPLLGPLADNGGPTQTHLPAPTSPAIDHVPLNSCIVATDQRGVGRPQPVGGACDSGAVERGVERPGITQVRGTATYGDPTATLTARLIETGDDSPLAGRTLSFTLNGQPVGNAVTDAAGVATLPNAAIPAGIPAGQVANAVCASVGAGAGYAAAGPVCGPLVVARRILWVKPTDRTVGLKQPTPPTTPPAGCLAQQTSTSACWLQLTNGSAFVNGDDWADLNLAQLRFAYSRGGNGPANEQVGAQYRITALGVLSTNYDVRYQTGTLRVVAP